MFGFISRKMAAMAFAATTLILTGTMAQAFSGGNSYSSYRFPNGCTFSLIMQPGTNTAYVSLDSGRGGFSGGSYFSYGRRATSAALSASRIRSLCGLSSVTNLRQNGADGSFASDGYIGVSFEGRLLNSQTVVAYSFGFSGTNSTRLVRQARPISDTTKPTLSFGKGFVPNRGTYLIYLSLSEASTNFTASDLVVKNGSITLTGNGANYRGIVTPTKDGLIEIQVPAGRFTDASGNGNIASSTVSVMHDTTPPVVTFGKLPRQLNSLDPVSVDVMFNETVFGLSSADFTLKNANVNSVSCSTSRHCRMVFVPTGTGDVSGVLKRWAVNDQQSNYNLETAMGTIPFDTIAPTVTIGGLPKSISGLDAIPITIDFSEPVTGFTDADITITGASLAGLSGKGQNFTAKLTPTGRGDITISIPAKVAFDRAGNGNIATRSMASTNMIVAEAQDKAAETMATRAASLIANQPNLTGFLSGGARGGLSADITRSQGVFDLSTNTDYPVWLRLKGSFSEVGAAETRYGFGAIGMHRKMTDTFLLGAMVQLDFSETTEGASTNKSQGWLIGPYAVKRLENQPLYIEGSILFGQTKSEIMPLGTYTNDVTTDRLMANLKLTGEIKTARVTWLPNLSFSHVREEQNAYTDGLGNPVAAQEVSVTEAAAGLHFEMPMAIRDQVITLTGGVSHILSKTDRIAADAGIVPVMDGGRSRVDLGLSHEAASGLRTQATAYVDGLGADDYTSVGLEVLFEYTF